MNTPEPIQFFSPGDIAAQTNLSTDSVYRYHREVLSRDLQNPMPKSWPMETPDARRFIEYIQKRTRKNKVAS